MRFFNRQDSEALHTISKRKQVAERMARNWDKKRKAKGWVAGNSPNLIPDFAK